MSRLAWVLLIGAAGLGVAAGLLKRREQGTTAPQPQTNWDMNKAKTTKAKRGTKDQPLESSSPIGHEEVERQMAAEAIGDGATPEPVSPSPAQRQARKKPEPDQPLNPRRQGNSRAK